MSELFIVATPIGNLGDITLRAIDILKNVDFIMAEDTRTTINLLKKFEINVPLVSYHKFSEQSKADMLLDRIEKGENAALVTDAGTPCISDPGAIIVGRAHARGIKVTGIPGASAIITALSVCGKELDNFAFYGFFPRKASEQKALLQKLSKSGILNAVYYESPRRIIDSLQSISKWDSNAEITVCNDITKLYEAIYNGNIVAVIDELLANPKRELGEYTFIIHNKLNSQVDVVQTYGCEAKLVQAMVEGNTMNEAIESLKKQGCSRNTLYQAKLNLSKLFENI